MKELKALIEVLKEKMKNNPNDTDLGKELRKLINKL